MKNMRIRWALFPLAYYGANAIWQGYMSLFYKSLNFSSSQIGLISAVTALCALAAQPLWGTLSDRSGRGRQLLSLLSLLSACALPLSLTTAGFAPQILFACLFYSFYAALLPMGDAILLQGLNRDAAAFGPYRLAGAASFALIGAGFGWLLKRSRPQMVVYCAALLLLTAAICALFLPESDRVRRKKASFAALFRNRDLMKLLGFVMPVQMTMGYFYTFFAPYFTALKGGDGTLLGLAYALATLSEVPYLLLSDKIYQKFGAARVMRAAAAVLALRWALLGLARSASLALLSQLLHGGGFIVVSVSMAKFIACHVGADLQASGQMLLNMASFGIARLAGNLGGGIFAQRFGSRATFLLGAAICLLCAAFFAPKTIREQKN